MIIIKISQFLSMLSGANNIVVLLIMDACYVIKRWGRQFQELPHFV